MIVILLSKVFKHGWNDVLTTKKPQNIIYSAQKQSSLSNTNSISYPIGKFYFSLLLCDTVEANAH